MRENKRAQIGRDVRILELEGIGREKWNFGGARKLEAANGIHRNKHFSILKQVERQPILQDER